jgi:hypothetical protein
VDNGSSIGRVQLRSSTWSQAKRVTLVELQRHFCKGATVQIRFQDAKGFINRSSGCDLQENPVERAGFLGAVDEGIGVCQLEEKRAGFFGENPGSLFRL